MVSTGWTTEFGGSTTEEGSTSDRASDDDPEHLFDGGLPLADLEPAVLAQRAHALAPGDARDVVGRGAGHGHPLDLLVQRHHLVQGHPAAVPGVRAAVAAPGAVERGQRLA